MDSFGYHGGFRYHLCPSSQGFVQFALAGVGYGMIAENQALSVPLYWHFWRHSGHTIQFLTTRLELFFNRAS